MRIEHKNRSTKKSLLLALTALLIVIAAVGAWWYFSHQGKQSIVETPKNTQEQKTAADAQNSNQPSTTEPSTTGTTSSKDTSTPATAPTLDTSVKPAAPDGTFVSNHRPNLGGSPAPNTESSVCHTTPGAQCTITFTNGSTTKSLATQAVDSSGNTTWNWNLAGVGLTVGEWTVTAKATNGSQVATTEDPLKLVINP